MRLSNFLDYAKLGENFLKSRGVDEAGISSERLLEKATGRSRISHFLGETPRVTKDQRSSYFDLLRKRAEFYPLQYLIQTVGFRNLELEVREGVLIPRPETELLVDRVHELFKKNDSFRLLDIGTGSGNIALSIADEFPNAQIWAVDVSREALETARLNAKRLGHESRVHFSTSDLLNAIQHDLRFDLIVSNPPYVPLAEKDALQKELSFEPATALFAGVDGLSVIKRILAEAEKNLTPKGHLILEIGKGQVEKISTLAGPGGYKMVDLKKDYAGIDRIVTLTLGNN